MASVKTTLGWKYAVYPGVVSTDDLSPLAEHIAYRRKTAFSHRAGLLMTFAFISLFRCQVDTYVDRPQVGTGSIGLDA